MSNKACCKTKIKPNPILKLPQGELEGFVGKSRRSEGYYYGFYGIPYAKKPKRFEPPEKWEEWSGTLDATKARDRCSQTSLITRKVFGSEDCLFVNVFTPKLPKQEDQDERLKGHENSSLLPVMFYIYGGGYYVGGGDLYGGKYLVDQDVILVTFNYRMGAFGFLNSGDGQVSGNMGLKDQVMCLKWVHENISYFGGDSNSITIFGESAGAACVHLHMMSSMSRGLFHKAIMQSGNALSPWAFTKNPVEKVQQLIKNLEVDCDTHQDNMPQMIEILKGVDSYAVAAQRMNFEEWKEQPFVWFAPSIESGLGEEYFLKESPTDIFFNSGKLITEVPLMLGVNKEEGAYRAVPIINNATKLKAINTNWTSESYQYLHYNKTCSLENHEELSSSIRKFYFGDKLISKNSLASLSNMFSDRMFNHSTEKVARHCCDHFSGENPIFLYIFAYEGEYSYLNSFGTMETYGATHADELQYIMDQRIFYSDIEDNTEDDFMIGKVSEIWGNFAKSGKPLHCWERLRKGEEKLKYYQISKKDNTVVEPFKERMDFWNGLKIE